MGKKLGTFLVFVAIVAGGVWWKHGEEKKTSELTLAQALEVLADAEGFEANRAYFTSLAEAAHPRAFDLSWTSGRRLRAGRLDDDRYLSELLDAMRLQALREKRQDIADSLADLHGRIDIP